MRTPIASIITILSLAACGGGGGSDTSNALTGTFIDAAVQGLAFETPTQNGITNSKGEFQYLSGEKVVFSIGEMKLPEVVIPTGGQVTPLHMGVQKSSDDQRVVNIAALLQTLDTDGDPENGITIPEQLSIDADAGSKLLEASSNAALFEELVSIKNAHPEFIANEVVTATDAVSHLERHTSGGLAGVWRIHNEEDVLALLTNGNFIYVSFDTGKSGYETGSYQVSRADASSGELRFTLESDHNGDGGMFSQGTSFQTIPYNVKSTELGFKQLTAMPPDEGTVVLDEVNGAVDLPTFYGIWKANDDSATLIFLNEELQNAETGGFIFINYGDDGGMQSGTATTDLDRNTTSFSVEHNGIADGGLDSEEYSTTFSSDGRTLIIVTPSGERYTANRLR